MIFLYFYHDGVARVGGGEEKDEGEEEKEEGEGEGGEGEGEGDGIHFWNFSLYIQRMGMTSVTPVNKNACRSALLSESVGMHAV